MSAEAPPRLKLASERVAPPGSFRIHDPELALINPALANIGPHHGETEWRNEWNKRRAANGLSPITREEAQHRLCQHLPPGWCVDELNQPTRVPGDMALSLADVVRGTLALLTWVVKGFPRVSDDEIVRRSYICNSCPRHVPITGCQGCASNRLRGIINWVMGGRTLPTDAMLQACGVCKCSLKAKTRLPAKDVMEHMKPEQRAALWDQCWLVDQPAPMSNTNPTN